MGTWVLCAFSYCSGNRRWIQLEIHLVFKGSDLLLIRRYISIEVKNFEQLVVKIRSFIFNFSETLTERRLSPESVATLPPFGPMEGQKWFD
jgi:hypothetical protein